MRRRLASVASVAAAAAADAHTEEVELSFAAGFPHRGRQAGALAEGDCSVAFAARGRPFCLRLALNSQLIPRGYAAYRSGAQGAQRVEHSPAPCHYIGHVDGDPYSSAGLSVCDGAVSGVVFAHGAELTLSGSGVGKANVSDFASLSGQMPYGAALRQLGAQANSFAGIARQAAERRKAAANESAPARRAAPQQTDTKYVEVLAVHDNSYYQAHGSSQTEQKAMLDKTVTIVNQVAAIYNAPPDSGTFVYKIQIVLVATWTFVDTDPYDSSVEMDGSEVDPGSLLSNFNTWTGEMGTRLPNNDNHLLLTRRDFTGNTVGLAGVSSMCSGTRSGSVNMCFNEASCSATIAHEMGHNLGMSHDGGSCPTSGFVMEAVGGGDNPTKFSKCSVDYLAAFFANDYAHWGPCLDNKPVKVFGDPVCGNGFIEEGEQCDCGATDCSGRNTCCDGATCKFLNAEYQCSDGPCCDSCKFVAASAAKVCRAKRGDCDIADTCPGGQEECDQDAVMYTGKPCTVQTYPGQCFGGECMSVEKVCTVEITQHEGKQFGMTDACRSYNDACGLLVCHETAGEDEYACLQGFYVEGQAARVPDGSPCWHPSDASGTRKGQCFKGACVAAGASGDLPHCGNGAIDWGEQCDCGLEADACCDCPSCRLKQGSQCAASEPCCTTGCQYRPQGTSCRSGVDAQCDTEETCTGSSGACPSDVGVALGSACLAGTAADGTDAHRASTCYAKRCVPSVHTQCKAQEGQEFANFGDRYVEQLSKSTCQSLVCCHDQPEGNVVYTNCRRVTSWVSVPWKPCGTCPSETSTIYLGGALDGTVLHEPAVHCLRGDNITRISASSCTSSQYFAQSTAVCVACHSSCAQGCTGPGPSDCKACAHGQDSRGSCATARQWEYRTTSTPSPTGSGGTPPPTGSGGTPPPTAGRPSTAAPTSPGATSPPTRAGDTPAPTSNNVPPTSFPTSGVSPPTAPPTIRLGVSPLDWTAETPAPRAGGPCALLAAAAALAVAGLHAA